MVEVVPSADLAETTTLTVNGTRHAVAEDGGMPLLEVLRDRLGLTGAKYGCGEGRCGACVVLLDGLPTPSCITSLTDASQREIVTVEGLAEANGTSAAGDGTRLHPVQQAFVDVGALQCGYCTPGMIVAAVALLRQNPQPSEAEIVAHLQPHVCRCGVYARIVAAVRLAAERSRGGRSQ
jgi:aerobic-type carbon monoxide dehydrogenase small subunit (CoxS/CutS family)